jgi:hypothetical protein
LDWDESQFNLRSSLESTNILTSTGYIETPMTMGDEVVRKVMADKVQTAVPMGRMGTPQEIADAVVYLAGGRSSFVTGTALFADGGYTQRWGLELRDSDTTDGILGGGTIIPATVVTVVLNYTLEITVTTVFSSTGALTTLTLSVASLAGSPDPDSSRWWIFDGFTSTKLHRPARVILTISFLRRFFHYSHFP